MLSFYESMAINFAHEIEHTTREAIMLNLEKASDEKKEETPIRIGEQVKKELLELNYMKTVPEIRSNAKTLNER